MTTASLQYSNYPGAGTILVDRFRNLTFTFPPKLVLFPNPVNGINSFAHTDMKSVGFDFTFLLSAIICQILSIPPLQFLWNFIPWLHPHCYYPSLGLRYFLSWLFQTSLPAPQTLLPPNYLNPLLRDEFSHRTAQIIPLYTYPKPSVDSHSLLKQSIQSPQFFPFLSFTAFHYTPYSNTTRLLIVLWPYCFRFLECPVSPSLHPNATSSMKRRLHLWLGVTFSVFSFFWHVESCCSLLDQIN